MWTKIKGWFIGEAAAAKEGITGLVGKVQGIVDEFEKHIATIEAEVKANEEKIAQYVKDNNDHGKAVEYAKRVRDNFKKIIE
jgi:hypothetical protein